MWLPPFVAPRLKLERAPPYQRRRAGDRGLYGAATVPLGDRAASRLARAAVARACAWTVRLREQVPLELSAVIGDALHNLRTALDLLACDLVRINGKSTKEVHFPFAQDAAGLKHQIKAKNLHRAGANIVRLVMSLKPYRGGNIALRALHDLDVHDKHQALIPVANVVEAPGGTLYFDGHPNTIPNWQSRITHDGQIVVMMPAVGNLSLGEEIAAHFALAFDETGPMAGREVVKTLHQLAELVAGILETFKAHCERSDEEIAKVVVSTPSGMKPETRILVIGSAKSQASVEE